MVSFVLMVIASVILAFVFGFEHSYYLDRDFFYAELFFPILLGGPLAAYLINLFVYGFGELIENSERISGEAKESPEREKKE